MVLKKIRLRQRPFEDIFHKIHLEISPILQVFFQNQAEINMF